jgi:hypothetical protein
MAMTIEELSGILTRLDIKHSFDRDSDIVLTWETENFKATRGLYEVSPGETYDGLVMHMRLVHDNTMFVLNAQDAFDIKGAPHLDAFLKMCSLIQMRGYLIQFEYVPTRGTVGACIELPLMDNKLTAAQVKFCLDSIRSALESFYRPLQKALKTGVLEGLPQEWLAAMASNEGGETSVI